MNYQTNRETPLYYNYKSLSRNLTLTIIKIWIWFLNLVPESHWPSQTLIPHFWESQFEYYLVYSYFFKVLSSPEEKLSSGSLIAANWWYAGMRVTEEKLIRYECFYYFGCRRNSWNWADVHEISNFTKKLLKISRQSKFGSQLMRRKNFFKNPIFKKMYLKCQILPNWFLPGSRKTNFSSKLLSKGLNWNILRWSWKLNRFVEK